MACVTLKRPMLDPLDPLNGSPLPHHAVQPNKRRRLLTPSKRHHHQEHRDVDGGGSSPTPSTSASSAFSETPMSPNQVANQLRDELKRLRRRKQINPQQPPQPHSPEPMDDLAALQRASGLMAAGPSSPKSASAASARDANKPIFTLKQMTMICERMCHERTNQIREEYDKILQQKLASQYDAFVKFIDHHIQQRFQGSQLPSYLS